MSSNIQPCQYSEAHAQALLAVFTLPPEPDFAAQILARAQPSPQGPRAASAVPALCLPATGSVHAWTMSSWPLFAWLWTPQRAAVCAVLVALMLLLWPVLQETPCPVAPGHVVHTPTPPEAMRPQCPGPAEALRFTDTPAETCHAEAYSTPSAEGFVAFVPPRSLSTPESPQETVQSSLQTPQGKRQRSPRHKSKRPVRSARPDKA